MSIDKLQALENRNTVLVNTISNLENQGHDAYDEKREFHENKLEMIRLIDTVDKRNGITAKELIQQVKDRPAAIRYETGIEPLDRELNGGFAVGSLAILGGGSFVGKCVDAETEFLSPSGWIKIKDYNGEKVARYDKSGKTVFVKPKLFYVDRTDKFYHLKTKQVDMMVTGSHRMPYLTSKGNLQKKTFKELYDTGKIYKARFINSFNLVKDTGINATDNEIRLTVAIYADASKHGNQWRVRLKKQVKKDMLIDLLNKCNVDFKEDHYGSDKDFSDFMFKFDKCTKDMTELYRCSSEQLKIVVDEVFKWDATLDRGKYKRFFTSIKEHADFVQYAISATGSMSTIRVYDRVGEKHSNSDYLHKSKEYVVSLSKWNNTTLSSNRTPKEDKITEIECNQELCYCFTMGDTEDNDMWIARRNNYVFVTGNTHITLEILTNIAKANQAIFFNFEMGDTKISQRLQRMKLSDTQLTNLIIDKDSRDLKDIETEMVLYARSGCKFFVIDSKMKIEVSGNSSMNEKSSHVTHTLSKIAQKYDIIVLLINQISEENLKSGYFGFKGSGDQLYDADYALFYTKDDKGVRNLLCTKNRIDEKEFNIQLKLHDNRTIDYNEVVPYYQDIKETVVEHVSMPKVG